MLYLWPDNDTESAHHLLSVAVHVLRKALGHDALTTTADEVALNPVVCRSDVAQFEEALSRGDAEAAVALYGGAFMDGFHVGTGPEFEQWLDGERARLQREYATALETVAQRRRDAGNLEGAVAAWRSIALLDPYSSHGALGLMRAFADAGNRVAAIRHAGIHRQLIRSELEAEPDPEVEALAEELRHAESTGSPQLPAGLTGRTTRTPPATPATPPSSTPAIAAGPAAEQPAAASAPAPGAAPAPPPASAATTSGRERRALVGGTISRGRWLLRRPRYVLLLAATIGLAAFGIGWFVAPRLRARTVQKVAVMPCVNRSPGDPTAELLADGIPDDIRTELGKEKQLQPVARNSSSSLDRHMDVRRIGELLDVNLVLACALERSGDRIGITLDLSRTRDAVVIWTGKYESPLMELFALKESIARAVTHELLGRADERLARAPDPVAYMHVLQGRQAWYQRSPQALEEAVKHFQQAVAVEPTYALAWADLAETYVVAPGYDYGVMRPDVAYPAAREAARRALELDPDDVAAAASAHAALATVYKDYDGNLEAAGREFRRALELNPSYSTARQWYSLLLVVTGRREEAREEIQKAGEYEPNSASALVARAHYYYYVEDYGRAASEIQQALAIEPDFGRAHLLLALIQIQMGQPGEARVRMQAMRARAPEPAVVATLGYAYGMEGKREEALACRRSLETTAKQRYVPAELFAMLDVALGDKDAAFADLEEMRRLHSNGSVYLGVEPIMKPLRGDPRFQALLARSPVGGRVGAAPAERRALPSDAE